MAQDYEKQGSNLLQELRLTLIAEEDVTRAQHEMIRQLLVDAFPEVAERFEILSYWGPKPEYRLWLEAYSGQIVTHLDIERRVISVGTHEVLVAGIGEVATQPRFQGLGLGRRLMIELQALLQSTIGVAYGYLICQERVAEFYARLGWHRLRQPTYYFNIYSGVQDRINHTRLTMILPASEPLECWPSEGDVDLRGMRW